MSFRRDVYRAWDRLKSTIAGSMDTRRYELATLAAAPRLRSSYCSLAHGKILADRFFDSRRWCVSSLSTADRVSLSVSGRSRPAATAPPATSTPARSRVVKNGARARIRTRL